MRIAVAGGTGAIGSLVVEQLKNAGHEPVVLARSKGCDLTSRSAVEQRLVDCESVIDVSGASTVSSAASMRYFTQSTANLVIAGRESGVQNHVALSIIGAVTVDSGYYAGKAAQERMLQMLPGGYTLLRTTQFYEFIGQNIGRLGAGPVQMAPKMRMQPIAGSEVAAALVALAGGPAQGVVQDLAGPQEEYAPDLIAKYLQAHGKSPKIVEVPVPGPMGKAMRDGGLLPGNSARLGHETFDAWLARQQPGSA
ncbi:SDR family oxidoreductase [Glutamicibacter sp. HZAU]|uniref:SDR family oxidoreductase n=1 Tax=Glutamicibacter sp. HZAU TaxID=2049891 RepID=UPI000FFC6EC7|nr:SDR family oxidoreductase [Glutamicibacter sp. HZAU]RWZ84525.1 SDR family oxidoreductase [Glutamicibacter sp. HZAU]